MTFPVYPELHCPLCGKNLHWDYPTIRDGIYQHNSPYDPISAADQCANKGKTWKIALPSVDVEEIEAVQS